MLSVFDFVYILLPKKIKLQKKNFKNSKDKFSAKIMINYLIIVFCAESAIYKTVMINLGNIGKYYSFVKSM